MFHGALGWAGCRQPCLPSSGEGMVGMSMHLVCGRDWALHLFCLRPRRLQKHPFVPLLGELFQVV